MGTKGENWSVLGRMMLPGDRVPYIAPAVPEGEEADALNSGGRHLIRETVAAFCGQDAGLRHGFADPALQKGPVDHQA